MGASSKFDAGLKQRLAMESADENARQQVFSMPVRLPVHHQVIRDALLADPSIWDAVRDVLG
jgi:hypothetical protein